MFTPPGPPSAPPMPAVLAPSLNGGSGQWTSPRRAVFSSPPSRAVAGAHCVWGRFGCAHASHGMLVREV